MTDDSGGGARRPDGGFRRPGDTDQGHGAAGEFAGIGLQFAGAILLFLFAGQWLDRKLGTAPWMLLIGVFTGAAAGFYSMYRKLMAIQAREEEARRAAKARRESEGSPR